MSHRDSRPVRKTRRPNRQALAHHEAAHFVVLHALGMHGDVLEISLRPRGREGGRVSHYADACSKRGKERLAVVMYAGIWGEYAFEPGVDDERLRVSGYEDYTRAWRLVCQLESDARRRSPLAQRLIRKARKLVFERIDAVGALADALLAHGSLQPADATAIVESTLSSR